MINLIIIEQVSKKKIHLDTPPPHCLLHFDNLIKIANAIVNEYLRPSFLDFFFFFKFKIEVLLKKLLF